MKYSACAFTTDCGVRATQAGMGRTSSGKGYKTQARQTGALRPVSDPASTSPSDIWRAIWLGERHPAGGSRM